MLARLRGWVVSLSAIDKLVASYAALVGVVGLVSLIPMLNGKDSVALWPLLLVSFPMSMLPTLIFQSDHISFQGMPDELNWLIPILVWAPVLLSGLIQAVVLRILLRRIDQHRRQGG
ncbi:SCO4225 family membrane protein [Microtetraspora fusca]|uniref:SCO4225 family membrane protein n=1 Tax=Microtetraspora fusca TaxID=1997 RepID=UPI00402BD19B